MLSGLTVAVVLAAHLQEPTPTPPGPDEIAPAAQASPRTREGRQIKEPRKTKYVAPKWPENALRAGLNGPVVLECEVGIDGRVKDVKVLYGYRSLAEAAEEAVRKWRYSTTELDGKAVPVIMTVTVNFKLPAPPKRDDLLASLTDSDPEIRWAAIKWLSRYRPMTGAQKTALERAQQDPDESVRKAAKEAVEKFEGK